MKILTLFLSLFLTMLPEKALVTNTSYCQDICFEEVYDGEEEAIIRIPQRIPKGTRASLEISLTEHKPVLIPVFHYHRIHFCFERQWLTACTLRR